MVQENPCAGTLLTIDKPNPFFSQVLESMDMKRIFRGDQKPKVPAKEVDHNRFHIRKIGREERDIVFAAFRVKEVGPGNIRVAHVEGLETIGASCIRREDIELRIRFFHEGLEHIENGVIAA